MESSQTQEHLLAGAGTAPSPLRFRDRGTEVSRVEGFSDAVFGFALTLLVISLEVPKDLAAMLANMRGALAFGVCFALLLQIWYKHHLFFRRYGLCDMPTIILNALLLFVVLMYVYPLRYLAWFLLGPAGDPARAAAARSGTIEQARELFVIYGAGFTAVFWLFALLYCRAYRLRDTLALNELERFDTRERIVNHFAVGLVGVLSIAIALFAAPPWVRLAGWCYVLIGVVEFTHGTIAGTMRQRLERVVR